MQPQAIRVECLESGDVALGVFAQIRERRTAALGQAHELLVVAQKIMHAGLDMHPAPDRLANHAAHPPGERTAGRRNTDDQRVGLRRLAK